MPMGETATFGGCPWGAQPAAGGKAGWEGFVSLEEQEDKAAPADAVIGGCRWGAQAAREEAERWEGFIDLAPAEQVAFGKAILQMLRVPPRNGERRVYSLRKEPRESSGGTPMWPLARTGSSEPALPRFRPPPPTELPPLPPSSGSDDDTAVTTSMWGSIDVDACLGSKQWWDDDFDHAETPCNRASTSHYKDQHNHQPELRAGVPWGAGGDAPSGMWGPIDMDACLGSEQWWDDDYDEAESPCDDDGTSAAHIGLSATTPLFKPAPGSAALEQHSFSSVWPQQAQRSQMRGDAAAYVPLMRHSDAKQAQQSELQQAAKMHPAAVAA